MAIKIPAKTTLCERFGQIIRDARLSMQLTQSDLALKVGLKRTQLANLETGRSWVGVEAFYGLISFLDLQIDKDTFARKAKTT